MDKSYKQLVLNVHQSDQVKQFVIRNSEKFTIGRRMDNSLTLADKRYPNQYELISQRNGTLHLNVCSFIDGEIATDSSRLMIRDLMLQDVLPRKGDTHFIKLTPHMQGFVNVGDVKIEFSFKTIKAQQPLIPPSYLNAFSWSRATVNNLTQDLLFKFIFLILFSINVLILYAFKDYVAPNGTKVDVTKITERLARFITRPTKEMMELERTTMSSTLETTESNNDSKVNPNKSSSKSDREKRSSAPRRGNPAASAGLLGLIAGTGSSGKSSSIVDALVDKGLVADLNKIVGSGSNLKVTNGGNNKDAIDPLDQLIGTGGSGGIDDFLSALEDDVPQVELKKQAKVDLVKPSKMSGSKEALGQRTEQSIWNVVSSRQGRIKYLYEKYLKTNPNLRGKITIEFTIAANGFVSEARMIESTINHPELEQELLALVRRLKFDPIPSGNVTTVFPFVFSKLN
jgi:TonB family protein